MVWQTGMYQHDIALHAGTNTFWDIFGILVKGALVPLIVRPLPPLVSLA